MNFVGDYKLVSTLKMKDDESGFEEVSVDDIDPNSKIGQDLAHMIKTILTVTEDGRMIYHMPIPEDAPADQVAQAEAAGKVVDGQLIIEQQEVKIEDGNIYLKDESGFLSADGWVKLNTENEGELKMVTFTYKKI